MRENVRFTGCLILAGCLLFSAAGVADFRAAVEEDWQLQWRMRNNGPQQPATVETDAAGGCDGLRDGKWGFHTENEKDPWWRVDLGKRARLDRVVLWNRCDAAPRNDNIMVQISTDGKKWRTVYTHAGPTFFGFTDNKPLVVPMGKQIARHVRVTLEGTHYLHLDEVEVFGAANPGKNLALGAPAKQSSISAWSADHARRVTVSWQERVDAVLKRGNELLALRRSEGLDVSRLEAEFSLWAGKVAGLAESELPRAALQGRWLQRELLLMDPLLDFDAILFASRVPGSFNHMSDQHYGWWSRPGGGLQVLTGYKTDSPELRCISGAFTEPGSFMRPSLSFDGSKVLFAWCKHYPWLADHQDKFNKDNVPEDAFYHVFEMNLDGSGLRQLTRGKYDDFDARYLPDGRIVFLSTRRGQFVQAGMDTAALTLDNDALPDCYVRCGGGPERPVAVYTLHTMNPDGSGMNAISPFEMFEWTPSVAHDGTILYSRWDYIDRDNMPYMSLWSIRPDGTNTRLIYKNYTHVPHCTFEPQCVPNSTKIVFTGSAHHAQTMGSLVLLDTAVGTEGSDPIKRITPEVVFPEIEGWPETFYTSPWPLSERLYLVGWGAVSTPGQGANRPHNDMGIYLYDADSGQLELLHRDPDLACEWPLPVTARTMPPRMPDTVPYDAPKEGRFLVTDVYQGLKDVAPGEVKALRVIAVPAKTHPTMNFPQMGLTNDDPGKCVLGTVPVESDGSAFFRVPSGVTLFFQALDENGAALQTMRGAVHVQPGQTMSCIGCHENRHMAPPSRLALAAGRAPSRMTPGPEGSWPFRFDRLVQPVLDRACVECHNPKAEDKVAAKFDLTPEKAWETLCNYGKPSLADTVRAAYRLGYSVPRTGPAVTSPVLALLDAPEGHYKAVLTGEERERLITWMDAYGQRLGAFSEEQEEMLVRLRAESHELLEERAAALAHAGAPASVPGR